MSNRVNPDELKEIIETSLSDGVLETFILAANLTVTSWLGSSTSVTVDQLKEIERWLAAHFLACSRERQPQSESAAGVSIAYQGVTEKGLEATIYGQQVKLLDSTGILAGAVGKKKPVVYAITSFE